MSLDFFLIESYDVVLDIQIVLNDCSELDLKVQWLYGYNGLMAINGYYFRLLLLSLFTAIVQVKQSKQ